MRLGVTVLLGLTLPQLSAADPELAGEGGLDPLRLAPLADRIADLLAPGVRARMSRVRFVTAIAMGALACEGLDDELIAKDEVTTAAIAFEWIVIEAFVRAFQGQVLPTTGIPGTQKARRVVTIDNDRLSARTYLKAPRVFGFNGIYKPFVIEAGVADSQLNPGVRARSLVEVWGKERGYPGFVDGGPSTVGGKERERIRSEVRRSLLEGQCSVREGTGLWRRIAGSLRPDQAGVKERQSLRGLILDPMFERRRELALLLGQVSDLEVLERDLLAAIRPHASSDLRAHIDAVGAYNALVIELQGAFDEIRVLSTLNGVKPQDPSAISELDAMRRAAARLPGLYARAAQSLNAVGMAVDLEEEFGPFGQPQGAAELAVTLIERHFAVQAGKPPKGKQPWFDDAGQGWVVRTPYRLGERQERRDYLHPYRARAVAQFMADTE